MSMINIGDMVWIPTATHEPVRTTCPDCMGTARWHCVLPCGEEFDVECPRCYHGGYDPSDGIVCESHHIVQGAEKATITGMELRDGVLRYVTERGYGLTDADICVDEASALERSKVKARAYWDEEDARLLAMAKRKGRPRKKADGSREANPLEFGGGASNYARGQVRAAMREANKWIAFAARHGTTIDLPKMMEQEKGGK